MCLITSFRSSYVITRTYLWLFFMFIEIYQPRSWWGLVPLANISTFYAVINWIKITSNCHDCNSACSFLPSVWIHLYAGSKSRVNAILIENTSASRRKNRNLEVLKNCFLNILSMVYLPEKVSLEHNTFESLLTCNKNSIRLGVWLYNHNTLISLE